jgi:hypothetical protein
MPVFSINYKQRIERNRCYPSKKKIFATNAPSLTFLDTVTGGKHRTVVP